MINLIKFLVTLVVILAVAGYFLDWYSFSNSDKKDTYEVTINKDKFGGDTKKFVEKAKELLDKLGGDNTITGKFDSFSLTEKSVTLVTESGEKATFKVGEEMLSLSNLPALKALQSGKDVKVTFEDVNGDKHAVKIEPVE